MNWTFGSFDISNADSTIFAWDSCDHSSQTPLLGPDPRECLGSPLSIFHAPAECVCSRAAKH